jgi:hypothetical protein
MQAVMLIGRRQGLMPPEEDQTVELTVQESRPSNRLRQFPEIAAVQHLGVKFRPAPVEASQLKAARCGSWRARARKSD